MTDRTNQLDALIAILQSLSSRLENALPSYQQPDWTESAFHWSQSKGFQAIAHTDTIALDDLLHIERQKKRLLNNTLKLMQGKPANHALLWGARGTGKSSIVKALYNEFSSKGLCMIEVDREELVHINQLTESLYQRKEKFIIFTDDLSFEEHDASYKKLKAVLDGSLSQRLDNVLIYATSNRRHLLPEKMSDNYDTTMVEGELHFGDAVEEKISLAERFGLWLSFYPLKQQQYLDIVDHWATKLTVIIDNKQTFHRAALQYALLRGSRSGRVARQFINDFVSPDTR